MTAINHMVNEMLEPRSQTTHRVNRADYDQWARGFIFEGLRDQRYGQSFCNRFGIKDNILFYSGSVAEADRYIQKNYLR